MCICRFTPMPRSACWALTARANRRCCKIMAGIDKEWNGEAWLADGATVRLPGAGAAA